MEETGAPGGQPTQTQEEDTSSTQKSSNRAAGSNPEPSCCEVTVLITASPWPLSLSLPMVQLILKLTVNVMLYEQ